MHDFLAIKNPGQTAVMKVHDVICSGPLVNTPMRVSKDFLPTTSVIPTVNDTYMAKNLVKDLGGVKLDDLKQMYTNFIQLEVVLS